MKHFPIQFLVLNVRLTGEDIKVKLIFTKHQQHNIDIYLYIVDVKLEISVGWHLISLRLFIDLQFLSQAPCSVSAEIIHLPIWYKYW